MLVVVYYGRLKKSVVTRYSCTYTICRQSILCCVHVQWCQWSIILIHILLLFKLTPGSAIFVGRVLCITSLTLLHLKEDRMRFMNYCYWACSIHVLSTEPVAVCTMYMYVVERNDTCIMLVCVCTHVFVFFVYDLIFFFSFLTFSYKILFFIVYSFSHAPACFIFYIRLLNSSSSQIQLLKLHTCTCTCNIEL